jgi:hypothetical protein
VEKKKVDFFNYDVCTGDQMPTTVAVPTVQDFARPIEENWYRASSSIFKVAKLCAEAKNTLTKVQLRELIGQLPFERSIFSKLSAIGDNDRLCDPQLRQLLPPHYSIVYEVTKLTDEELDLAVDEGVIHPKATRVELIDWKFAQRGGRRRARKDVAGARNRYFAAIILPAKCDAQRIVFELERMREQYGVNVIFGHRANDCSRST